MDVSVRAPLLTAAFWRSRRSGLTLLVAAGAHQWTQLVFPAWVLLLSLVILFDRPLSHDSRPEPGELSTHQPS